MSLPLVSIYSSPDKQQRKKPLKSQLAVRNITLSPSPCLSSLKNAQNSKHYLSHFLSPCFHLTLWCAHTQPQIQERKHVLLLERVNTYRKREFCDYNKILQREITCIKKRFDFFFFFCFVMLLVDSFLHGPPSWVLPVNLVGLDLWRHFACQK